MPASRRADPASGVPAVVLAVVLLAVSVALPLVEGAPAGWTVLVVVALLAVGVLSPLLAGRLWVLLALAALLVAAAVITPLDPRLLPAGLSLFAGVLLAVAVLRPPVATPSRRRAG